MNLPDMAKMRLFNQQIAESRFTSVKELSGWMGALQAQDYGMSKWAVGIRLPNSTEQEVETAIKRGELMRTHVLRPTWHLVSAEDIYWMLELTASHIKAASSSRHKQLGLTEEIFAASNQVIENALKGGKHLTREELVAELEKANIATGENRASHLLAMAELDGIACSGAARGKKQTYALLEERVPKPKGLSKEEALAKLARKYFASRGPATLQDFTWWSGLPAREARLGLELVKADFISESRDGRTYWFAEPPSVPRPGEGKVYLLPAFDEFIISYTERSAAIRAENQRQAIISNGIFRPVIVADGQAIGIWKQTIKKDQVIVETEFFSRPDPAIQNQVEQASTQYQSFKDQKAT